MKTKRKNTLTLLADAALVLMAVGYIIGTRAERRKQRETNLRKV